MTDGQYDSKRWRPSPGTGEEDRPFLCRMKGKTRKSSHGKVGFLGGGKLLGLRPSLVLPGFSLNRTKHRGGCISLDLPQDIGTPST